jgi:predicted DNA-binding WGR domain protein
MNSSPDVTRMTAVHLHRIDPSRNMRRFYALDVQPDLFGAWMVMRRWGRLGTAGQVRGEPYQTPAEAGAALARQRRIKERRGYVCIDMEKGGGPHGRTAPITLTVIGFPACTVPESYPESHHLV